MPVKERKLNTGTYLKIMPQAYQTADQELCEHLKRKWQS